MGILREVERIEPGVLQGEAAQGPVVLLVNAASGDEEVGAAGIDLRGVLLCHTVPHLSHLGESSRLPGPLALWQQCRMENQSRGENVRKEWLAVGDACANCKLLSGAQWHLAPP